MRNIRLTLEYDGSAYAGWQVQENAPTVQGAVERALEALAKHPVRIRAAGRTDAGVHALGQVVNFVTECRAPLRGFLHGLNGLLPEDISVRRVDRVRLDFDSRRHAREKTYQYFLHVGVAPSAFARRTSWRIPTSLDLRSMSRAAASLVGTHDFGAFRSAGCDAPHAVRALHEARVFPRNDYVEFRIRGTAFLRHMVRIVVGTLVEVGLGKRSAESVRDLLEHRRRGMAGPTAPPQGLFLTHVRYDAEPMETFP